MKNLISLSFVLFALLLPSLSSAEMAGVWKGALSINGKICKQTTIEIKKTNELLTIRAALDEIGNHAVECGTPAYKYYMDLNENYSINGNELYRYGKIAGEITPQKITAQDGQCNQSGCEFWDYIKITQINDNKISIWVDFDGAILTGVLTN